MQYKTAIVTGASRGLGRAVAKNLWNRGLNVMLAARSENDLQAAVRSISEQGDRVGYSVVDLSSADSIHGLIEATHHRFGAVDVLINNAGIGTYKPLLEWSEQEVMETVNVNLTGLMLTSRAVLPDMMAARRGLIINVASDLSRKFLPNMAPYVATKFGVLGFSGSLLREVKQFGIKVCIVMPGIIDTNFNQSKEGSREETWALPVDKAAEIITSILNQPEFVVVDEITVHPLHQDF